MRLPFHHILGRALALWLQADLPIAPRIPQALDLASGIVDARHGRNPVGDPAGRGTYFRIMQYLLNDRPRRCCIRDKSVMPAPVFWASMQ